MAEQRLVVADVQERVDHAAVTYIYLRRFDQALADVGLERQEPPRQQQIDHQVEVARDGLPIHGEPAREMRRVEQAPLHVRQHSPEAMQRARGNAWTKLGYVTFPVSYT